MRIQGLTTEFSSVLSDNQKKLSQAGDGGGIHASSGSQDRDAQGNTGYFKERQNPDDGDNSRDKEGSEKEIDLENLRREVDSFRLSEHAQSLHLEAVVLRALPPAQGLRVVLKDQTGRQVRSMSPEEFLVLRRETQLQAGLAGNLQRGRLLDRKA